MNYSSPKDPEFGVIVPGCNQTRRVFGIVIDDFCCPYLACILGYRPVDSFFLEFHVGFSPGVTLW